jgi:hypothetical protein
MRLSALLALFGLGLVASQDTEQPLELDSLRSAFVNEDSFQYYSVTIPRTADAIKVKLIPSYGDPDAYLSFTAPEPDDLTATWVMDDVGAEEQLIKRDAVEFCQYDPCVLHISVYGYDESEYMIGVYVARPEGPIQTECAPGCKQDNIADGICQQVRPSPAVPPPAAAVTGPVRAARAVCSLLWRSRDPAYASPPLSPCARRSARWPRATTTEGTARSRTARPAATRAGSATSTATRLASSRRATGTAATARRTAAATRAASPSTSTTASATGA